MNTPLFVHFVDQDLSRQKNTLQCLIHAPTVSEGHYQQVKGIVAKSTYILNLLRLE